MMRTLGWLALAAMAAACGDDGGGAQPGADAGPDARTMVATFPATFVFGSANAPYQVEGGLHGTDWYDWESKCPVCVHDHADDGPDFWTRYDADFAIAQADGHKGFRLGIEWARVFPNGMAAGPDAAAVAHYHDILRAARARGLNPMVTLHHFSNPTWLTDGWLNATVVDQFTDWARWAATEYGGEVDWWITINEPIVYVQRGFLIGDWPPGVRGSVPLAIKVVDAMLAGHARAYDAIHEADKVDADGDGKAAWVSIASHQRVFRGATAGDADDAHAAAVLQAISNRLFFDAMVLGKRDLNYDLDFDDPGETGLTSMMGRMDYLGVNYYGIALVQSFGPTAPPPLVGQPVINDLSRFGLNAPINDMGWAIYPEGFGAVLEELRPYGLPIVVTENGIADADDNQRPKFLIDHLTEVSDKIASGLDIRGYYHWSLVDNFEWANGYCPRFGLVSFDAASPQKTRTRRGSADVYKEIIAAHGISAALAARYPSYPEPGLSCPRVGQ